jgi:exodeoxyribonuclease VII large subunit
MAEGFFDVREKLVPPRGARPAAAPAPGTDALLSVSAVTKLVERAIRTGVPPAVAVRGEVSNFNHNRASGHAYFTLKDPDAVLNCVMFKGDFERVKFAPVNGMELMAIGSVRVYAAQGRHQLYVNHLQPLGQGALELAFQQLRAKLEAEGLFAPGRKRPVPRYPTRIVLVTSRQTAALQDMLKVLRRFPWLRLMLCHVPVQGDGCGAAMAKAITGVNEHIDRLGGADLILLGRGGGSLEDLCGFNDESLARAIAASRLPVITGIGHEVDVSIADLVADHHAHTPTEAATVATAGWRTVTDELRTLSARMTRQLDAHLRDARHRLAAVEQHEFFRRPTDRIDDLRQRLDDRGRSLQLAVHALLRRRGAALQSASDRLARQTPAALAARTAERLAQMQRRLTVAIGGTVRRGTEGTASAADRLRRAAGHDLRRRAERVASLSAHLEALSPQRTLERGYTVTRRSKGGVVRSAGDLREPDRIVTRFADGEVASVVEDADRPKLF